MKNWLINWYWVFSAGLRPKTLQKETLAQMFSSEFCEIFKKHLFYNSDLVLNNLSYQGFIIYLLLFIFFFATLTFDNADQYSDHSFLNWIQNFAPKSSDISYHLVFLGNTLEPVGIWYSLETTLAISQIFPAYLPRIFQSKAFGQGGSL